MKKRVAIITLLIVSMLSFFVIMNVQASSPVTDAADDVKGIKITDDYDLLSETSAFSFIDLRQLSWSYDSMFFNASLQFEDDVNTTKIIDDEVSGWVSFGLEPAIATNLIPLVQFSYNKTVGSDAINFSCIVYDGDTYNKTTLDCGSIADNYINWSVSIELFANFTGDNAVVSSWTGNSFSIYAYSEGDTDYVYWDSVSVTTFWDELYTALDEMEQVPGYDLLILTGVVTIITTLLVIKVKRRTNIN